MMKDHFLVVSSEGKFASFVGGIQRSANMMTTLSILPSLLSLFSPKFHLFWFSGLVS